MLDYNTQLKRLVLPEYGRNIQKMVDHCMTIDDREERTQLRLRCDNRHEQPLCSFRKTTMLC